MPIGSWLMLIISLKIKKRNVTATEIETIMSTYSVKFLWILALSYPNHWTLTTVRLIWPTTTSALYFARGLDQNYQSEACRDRSNDQDLQTFEYAFHFRRNNLLLKPMNSMNHQCRPSCAINYNVLRLMWNLAKRDTFYFIVEITSCLFVSYYFYSIFFLIHWPTAWINHWPSSFI